ncbi:MAG: type II toxin-antitoxin system RelE/ParE family toxin [Candidatus Acidiferrales bacterium]
MKCSVVWTRTVWQLFHKHPDRDREAILEKLPALEYFPQRYPIRMKSRRFRRHRWFHAGNWLVYYRVSGDIVYIRCLWPAQIP